MVVAVTDRVRRRDKEREGGIKRGSSATRRGRWARGESKTYKIKNVYTL